MREKKLCIAIIQQSPDIGGAETYMYNLIAEFTKKGHTVYLLVNKGKFETMVQTLPIHIVRIPTIIDVMGNIRGLLRSIYRLPFLLLFYTRFLYGFKFKHNGDVIFSAGYSEKLLISFLSIFLAIPVVWMEYAPLKVFFARNFSLPKFLYIILSKVPKKIILISKNTYTSVVRDAHIAKDKLLVVPCGTYIQKNVKKDKKYKNLLGLENCFVIGNVSRLTREKGQQYLIVAMSQVLRTVPNARLLILGQGPDREYFNSLIKKQKLEKYVSLLGYQEDIKAFYSAMDVFVFPTPWELEGFGLVSIEAMAYRLPVVATNFGPVPEIVKHNKSGILVEPRNVKELAEAIIILVKDSNKRKQFGEYGYLRAKAHYDITKTSDTILSVLKNSL